MITALLVLLLTGCAGTHGVEQPEDTRTPVDDNLIVVGVSQVGSESVWRTANTASIQNIFTKENGYFLIFNNARQKQENQIKALRSFISQRVDYIVFSPITEDGWETVLQEAKEAGIPVILIDRKVNLSDQSLYTTWIGSDFYKEGRMAGNILDEYLTKQHRQEESIRIVVLQGTEGATATIGRTNGFNEVAEAHDNWLILEQADGEFTTAKGQEEMETLLHRYKDIDVVISQNDDMTFGALTAIQNAGLTAGEDGDIMVISFDAVKSGLQLVDEGLVTADIECNPNQGEYVETVIRKLENDEAVAKLIVNEIPDGACLQLGIGGMPNAVGSLIAKSDLKDLGVHTEMYVDAFVDIAMAGKITGAKKNIDKGRQVYGFGAGTKKLYDYLNRNPECMSAPVSYTNDIRTISALDNFMSINNAVDLDLFGQVNAESAGIKHISGAGGQLDFVLGAYLSKGGKSFICCSSTFKTKDGQLKSRILPTLNPGSIVTDTRANTHHLVTEYGMVNLKGLSTWQRAEAIISIAHPQFRDELIAEAEKMHIWRRSNKR